MERNQVIGLVLIAALLIGYATFFRAPEEPIEETPQQEETINTIPQDEASTPPQEAEVTTEIASDSSENVYEDQYGIFAVGAVGEKQQLIVENDYSKFTFSSKGGQIESVELKEFLTYDKKPLMLFDKTSSQRLLRLPTTKGIINISDLYFNTASKGKVITKGDTAIVIYTLTVDANNSIEQKYVIPGSGYKIDYEIKVNGLQNNILGDQLNFVWLNRMKRFEKNLKDSRIKSSIRYYSVSGDSDGSSASSDAPQEEQLTEATKWASFDQKFFNAGIIADKSFAAGGTVNTEVPVLDSATVKIGAMNFNIPMTDVYEGGKFTYYFGPNNYKLLKKVTPGYADNIDMGYVVVSWVNKYIIVELFAALQKVIPSYGLIIIIMVFIIKLVLFPLSRKSYLSMAKMKALKPELDKLKEKYGNDMQKMQPEQMKLYRQVGVNPLSGCIPMVLQMPILFAMFFFFPNSIELRQQSFLWATDLSTYDVLLQLPFTIPFYGSHVSGFTLLMTLSTILYTWSNNQVSTVQGPMKTIGYIMPVIFMFVLNSYSSGLSFYYFVSNLVTFGQQALIRRFVDEEKIRKTLEENKKKNANKKKSKFQMKLEDAMKASQEAQKQKRKK